MPRKPRPSGTNGPDFEELFQDFLAAGGFEQRCVGEDYERVRPKAQIISEKCKHGLTLLTCAHCYFERQ